MMKFAILFALALTAGAVIDDGPIDRDQRNDEIPEAALLGIDVNPLVCGVDDIPEDICGDGAFCNDGRCDCIGDGFDIMCANGVGCVGLGQLCDGYLDCEDGSDELVGGGDGQDGGGQDGGGNDGGGSSSSGGDPHFVSMDGVYFDYQGLGLHWMVQPADTSSLAVQTCHRPWVSNPTNAAVNEAVSVRLGDSGSVFTLAYEESSFVASIDGTPTTNFPQQIGDYIISSSSSSFSIRGVESGDSIRLQTSSWSQWINVDYAAGPETSMRGLLGTNDGIRSNDFTLQDGSTVTASWQNANDFGASWRVIVADSFHPNACSDQAPDYASFDIFEWFVQNNFPVAAGAEDKPRRQMREEAFDSTAFTSEQFDDALSCYIFIRSGSVPTPSELFNAKFSIFDAINDSDPLNDAGPLGALQGVFDILFFGDDATCEDNARIINEQNFFVGMTEPGLCCSGVGSCATDPLVGVTCECPDGYSGDNCETFDPSVLDPVDPVEGEEAVAMCGAAGRCTDVLVQSPTKTATISWSASGDCDGDLSGGTF